MYLILIICLTIRASAVPINLVQKAADNDFEKLDNYLPKVDDLPKFHYSTFGENTNSDDDLLNVIEFRSSHKENPRTFSDVVDFVKEVSYKY
ncbi:hypothetical protein MTP99_012604 [Tenebrio molitor]|nr:hypothetical protein MTP99_012604 [Tenebrio molitor]